jgi:hypothetical protein
MDNIIEKWKELNIDRAEFEFSCGGDSMDNTNLSFYDKNNQKVIFDFETEIEDMIYNNVQFYENSDGEYMGENGVVIVELEDDEFTFAKDAQSEYSNTYTDTLFIEISKKQYDYLNKYVKDYNTEENFTYKIDFFLSDEMEKIEKDIIDIINKECDEHEIEYNGNGEIEEIDEYILDNLELLGKNTIQLNFNYRAIEYENSN